MADKDGELTVGSSYHFTQNCVPLFTELLCVVTLHMLLKIADVIVFGIADWADVLRVLAVC